ncbi:uncharacterized protein LOC123534501 [Mercenaria mercenaria]|uniref:uncharacterized protein LOC123534501 n=1 Tax=Mercenaria mercenaria TaxID=6596 RepID=UPI00234F178C|nr:uncharacterized protein LOC123534501 [Mercenaria mercenaria]
MSTRRKFNEMFDRLLSYRPRYVFINLGGNDITAECDAQTIYLDIIDIVGKLYNSGVERVFVASIVERGKFPHWTGLNHKIFTVCRRYINKKLKKYLRNDFVQVGKRLMFPRHYDSDLVHPGFQEGGMNIFKHEILRAFKRTL